MFLSSGAALGAEPAAPAKAPTTDSQPAAQERSGQAATQERSDQAATAKPEQPDDEPGVKPKGGKAGPAEKDAKSTAADKKPSPQRFVPSEQVRADFDVSFPIDI